MAADKRTAMLAVYQQVMVFIPFLTTFFRTTPNDIKDAESFKIEIKRGSKKIAPVISNITQLGGKIERSQYTQKEFTPPVVALGADFAPGDLIEKAFGKDEYSSASDSYAAQLQALIIDAMQEIEARINRSIEFQCSQILQTGELTLYDKDGNAAFILDFFPKATHFPTVSVSWSDEDSDPDADIEALARVIKTDGSSTIKNLIFGSTARANYLKNSKVNDKFDITRIQSGQFQPREINEDVTYLGDLLIGSQYYQCWEYTGEYIHPSTGLTTRFIPDDKVVLLPAAGSVNFDFRKVYCTAPTITGVDPRFASIVPTRMSLEDRAYTARVWADGNSDTLNTELKTRPLCVPVSIDVFGCLDTEV